MILQTTKSFWRTPFYCLSAGLHRWIAILSASTFSSNKTQRKAMVSALAAKLVSLPAAFFFNVMISRRLGSTMVGEFYLCLAVTTLLGVAARLGLDAPLLRHTAQALRSGRYSAARLRLLECGLAIGTMSLALSLIIIGISDAISVSIFAKPAIGGVLRCFSLSIVPASLLQMACSALKGTGATALALLLEVPAVVTVFLTALFLLPRYVGDARHAAAMYTICSLLVSVAALTIVWWKLRPAFSERSDAGWTIAREFRLALQFLADVRSLVTSSTYFYRNDLLLALLGNLDSLLLGIWASERNIGLFNAVLRLSLVSSWFRIPIYTAGIPEMVGLWTEGRLAELQSLAVRASRLVCAATLPVFIVFMLFPRWCLLPFGHEFPTASLALLVVSAGKCFETALGPSRELLVFCGQERSAVRCLVGTCLFQCALSGVLISTLGLSGAAVSNFCATAALAIFTARSVKERIGVQCWAIARVGTPG